MIHKVNLYGALLTDSSKTFDCVDHILLIFKLFAFAVSPFFLKYTLIYQIWLNKSKSINVLVVELLLNLTYPRVLLKEHFCSTLV